MKVGRLISHTCRFYTPPKSTTVRKHFVFRSSGMPVLTVHMPSDHDDETVSSSDSGRASPAPATVGKRNGGAAAAGKGILVHSNKKSANTNRVSFVTGNGGSSAPPPSVRRSKKNDKPRPTAATDNQSFGGGDDGDGGRTPYYARTGRRLTGFGVKSHLHEFYDNPDRGGDTRQVRIRLKYCGRVSDGGGGVCACVLRGEGLWADAFPAPFSFDDGLEYLKMPTSYLKFAESKSTNTEPPKS